MGNVQLLPLFPVCSQERNGLKSISINEMLPCQEGCVEREGSNKVTPEHLVTIFWVQKLLSPKELTKTQ